MKMSKKLALVLGILGGATTVGLIAAQSVRNGSSAPRPGTPPAKPVKRARTARKAQARKAQGTAKRARRPRRPKAA